MRISPPRGKRGDRPEPGVSGFGAEPQAEPQLIELLVVVEAFWVWLAGVAIVVWFV